MPTKKDSKTISKTDMQELQYWSKKFGCSIVQLLDAMESISNDSDALAKYFKKKNIVP